VASIDAQPWEIESSTLSTIFLMTGDVEIPFQSKKPAHALAGTCRRSDTKTTLDSPAICIQLISKSVGLNRLAEGDQSREQ